MWIRIDEASSTVCELTDIDPAGKYHPSLNWIKHHGEVGLGWQYSNNTPTAPATPQQDYPRLIAERRYQEEISGTTFNATPINTDRQSQQLITGAALAASLDPNYSAKWKTGSGFIELSASQIIALASVVREHVQACFNREAELLQSSVSGNFTEDMLDEGWP